jgi:hypothetical protein
MSTAKSNRQSDWTLLILTIPGRQPALRVRTWRRLKTIGVGALQDGVYVVPAGTELRAMLEELAAEIRVAGGSARVLDVTAHNDEFGSLFDRAAEYQALLERIRRATPGARQTIARATRATHRLRRELDAIGSRDFFAGEAQMQARHALDELSARVERLRSPGEPHSKHGRIKRRDAADFLGRTWVTREDPWVDRLASGWLIRRFIDPLATFKWAKRVTRRTGGSTGFDFDGAAFTHVDGKVTFEVLAESFALDGDAALVRIGAMVHYLDIGGVPIAEASVIETVLRGLKRRARSDDALFALTSRLLDDLYAGYKAEESAR